MDLPELWAILGPAVAGAVFGTGWWFWIDAVVCSSVTVSFVHYLPGIFASIAALMFNCVRKEDIDYSPYEEGEWSVFFVKSAAMLSDFQPNIEALAFLCICRLLCLFSSISGFVDSRFNCQNRAFSVDRNCWRFAVCVRADKVNEVTEEFPELFRFLFRSSLDDLVKVAVHCFLYSYNRFT
ncbi:hypothetical protein H0E87_004407 [Populus deltoides]|uniref:Uncharacterized protein n=1 Tax=Populus deltoides TaxID=3696 RepID=A0A8T2ZF39_POPDE|nr:hypothetical protein H0E87_004407 [Populus deltoides]